KLGFPGSIGVSVVTLRYAAAVTFHDCGDHATLKTHRLEARGGKVGSRRAGQQGVFAARRVRTRHAGFRTAAATTGLPRHPVFGAARVPFWTGGAAVMTRCSTSHERLLFSDRKSTRLNS